MGAPNLLRARGAISPFDAPTLSVVLLYKDMQPFERDRQEQCVIQKTRQAAATLLKMWTERKLWTEKCAGQDRGFQPMLSESECETKN